jgi:uncharacterized protein (UPF0262 family)
VARRARVRYDAGVESAGLVDILIDDVTWSCATRARRAEWQVAIAELVEEAVFVPRRGQVEGPLRAYVTVHKAGIAVVVHDRAGQPAGRLELPQQTIAPLFREYMAVIREMVSTRMGIHSVRFDALDIAKRLAHDDAAELIIRQFHDLSPDLCTARRLFTLLVLLVHDTTKLGLRSGAGAP